MAQSKVMWMKGNSPQNASSQTTVRNFHSADSYSSSAVKSWSTIFGYSVTGQKVEKSKQFLKSQFCFYSSPFQISLLYGYYEMKEHTDI